MANYSLLSDSDLDAIIANNWAAVSNEGLDILTRDDAVIEDEDEEGGFFDAIGLGVDVLQQQLGSAVEGIGEATGIDSLTEYGREVVENNEKEIAENSAGMTSFDELAEDPSFGEAWKFYKEQLGQQVPQLAGSLGVATAGGALAGPLGAVAGAAIGYLPVVYGQHRESQK